MNVLVRRGRSYLNSFKCLLIWTLDVSCFVTVTVLYYIAFRLLDNIILASLMQVMITIIAYDCF